jgi:hypothetical protein
MKRKIFMIVSSIILISQISFASIDLSGGIRNDAVFFQTTNNINYEDVLEDRLIFTRNTDEWRFYADLRLYAYYGQITGLEASPAQNQSINSLSFSSSVPFNYSFDLLRAFVRYESSIGVWTAGKTYVAFGNFGIFNPFEFNKTIDFNDLSYDKDGILALLYEHSFSDLSGIKVYIGPEGGVTNSMVGGSLFGHLQSFDGGFVYNRKGFDTNVAGIYLKGDLEVGVNFSYAYHFNDYLTNSFAEISAGLDYSFFDGKLITALTYYYDERGATSTNNYLPYGFDDVYFTARNYLFGDITYTYDEFLSFELYLFWNLEDLSGIIAPSVKYTLADGLYLTVLLEYITGNGSDEFSSDRLAQYAIDIRLEAKL